MGGYSSSPYSTAIRPQSSTSVMKSTKPGVQNLKTTKTSNRDLWLNKNHKKNHVILGYSWIFLDIFDFNFFNIDILIKNIV